MHLHEPAHVRAHEGVHKCTCTHFHVHARAHACTHEHAHAHTCTHMHVCARTCTSVIVHVCARANPHVHVCGRTSACTCLHVLGTNEHVHVLGTNKHVLVRGRTSTCAGRALAQVVRPTSCPGISLAVCAIFLLGLVRTSVNPLSTTGVGSACARRSSHCGRDWPPQCLFVTKVVTREENSQKVKNIKIHFGRKWSSQNAAPGCGNHSSLWLKVVYNCCGQRATRKLRSIGPHFAIYQNRSGAEHHSCTRLDAHSGRIFAFYRHETTDGASIDCSAHPYLRVASSKYLEDYHGQAVYGVIHTSHRASAFEPLDYPCPRSSTGFLRIRPNVLPIRH